MEEESFSSISSVTGGAGLRRVDVPMPDQFLALRLRKIFRPLPIEVEHFLRRTDMRRRIAMAIQAETHAQRLGLRHFIHLVHFAVALNATDAAIHVHGVIEIGEVGQLVDLNPRNGSVVRRAFADRREAIVSREHLVMAIHANAGTRNVRIPRLLDIVMAIAAINAELVGVNGMREKNRLLRLITDICVFRGEIVGNPTDRRGGKQRQADQNEGRQLIRPLWKNIRHST